MDSAERLAAYYNAVNPSLAGDILSRPRELVKRLRSDRKLSSKFERIDGVESVTSFEVGEIGTVHMLRPERGKSIDVGELVADHNRRNTVFNMGFLHYGELLKPFISSNIPEEHRLREDSDRVRVLGFSQPRAVRGLVSRLSVISSLPVDRITEGGLDYDYRRSLKRLCERLHSRTEWISADDTLVPLRGGALIASMLPELPREKVIPIDSKRIPLQKEGALGLGLNFPGADVYDLEGLSEWMDGRMQGLDGKNVRILEVAVASGLTSVSYLFEFAQRQIKPNHIEVVAPVVAQQGVELLLYVSDILGFDVSVVAADMHYRLGDFWRGTEDSIMDDQGNWVIGKATNILERFLKLERFTPNVINGTDIDTVD